MITHTTQNSLVQQKGAGMLEVLVALLVLSIGILGLATLQSIGLKYNTQSYQRTQAIMHIYDLADRIRSNVPGKATAYNNFAVSNSIPAFTDCTAVACDSAQRATFDIAQWRQSLLDQLGPATTAGVRRLPGTLFHVIEVDWIENDIPKSFVYEAQL